MTAKVGLSRTCALVFSLVYYHMCTAVPVTNSTTKLVKSSRLLRATEGLASGQLFGDDIPQDRPLSGNYLAQYPGFHKVPRNSGNHYLNRRQFSSKSTFTNDHHYEYTGGDASRIFEYPTSYVPYGSPRRRPYRNRIPVKQHNKGHQTQTTPPVTVVRHHKYNIIYYGVDSEGNSVPLNFRQPDTSAVSSTASSDSASHIYTVGNEDEYDSSSQYQVSGHGSEASYAYGSEYNNVPSAATTTFILPTEYSFDNEEYAEGSPYDFGDSSEIVYSDKRSDLKSPPKKSFSTFMRGVLSRYTTHLTQNRNRLQPLQQPGRAGAPKVQNRSQAVLRNRKENKSVAGRRQPIGYKLTIAQ